MMGLILLGLSESGTRDRASDIAKRNESGLQLSQSLDSDAGSGFDQAMKSVNISQCQALNHFQEEFALYKVLRQGCISTVISVCLKDDHLLVGNADKALKDNHFFPPPMLPKPIGSLTKLYVEPLTKMRLFPGEEKSHKQPTRALHSTRKPLGLFGRDPSQTFTLVISLDNPSSSAEFALAKLEEHLQPLHDAGRLTYHNETHLIPGPITIVASGNTPFNKILDCCHFGAAERYVFYDAPLLDIARKHYEGKLNGELETRYLVRSQSRGIQGRNGQDGEQYYKSPEIYTEKNSMLASANFRDAMGWTDDTYVGVSEPDMTLTQEQRYQLQLQVEAAHSQKLGVRYWGVPEGLAGLTESIWKGQNDAGVDMIAATDLATFNEGEWRD
ncbi:MAG: Altered inheritance of mitochondria protein 6 [Chrysothrix sp. TS-e1954]|nr:MAG: Altered inheritance of mitochondria protein 6 [Chrysothrix sp. TS-e1954]